MARILSLILSTILVSSSLVQAKKKGLFPHPHRYPTSSTIGFVPTAVKLDLEECYGNNWQNDVTTRFTGIFFGDFTTGGGTDILGGLAVQGNFHAPNYVVNANHGANCSALDSLNSYGLVVGGITDTFNTHVHGSAYLRQGGTVDEISELNEGCIVTQNEGTGIFDFDLVKELAIASNLDFSALTPTAILESDGTITYLSGDELALYEVIAFSSCGSSSCGHSAELESDPNAIILGQGNWNGVQGSVIDPIKTYVMNVPVLDGTTIELNTNNPSLGFNPCKLIYNFYPVDTLGRYKVDGEFTLIRRTANQFGGFTLAPRGHIIDGSIGNFAGNIVGLNYTWENLNAGVEIHDYHAAGGDCDYYEGCIPVHVTITPTPDPTSSDTASSTTSRTRSWSSTFTPDPDSSTSDPVTFQVPNFSLIAIPPCFPGFTDTITDTTTATITDTITVTNPGETTTTTAAQVTITNTESYTETDTVTKTLIIIRPTTSTVTSECDKNEHHHSKNHKGHHHGPDEECDEDDEDDKDDEDYHHKHKDDGDNDDEKYQDDDEKWKKKDFDSWKH